MFFGTVSWPEFETSVYGKLGAASKKLELLVDADLELYLVAPPMTIFSPSLNS
jgi:hypothetical protein